MPKKFSLEPLVLLAKKQNEAAIRKFGQLNQQQQAAQEKLETLHQYRRDYQEKLQQAEQHGISQSELRNFQNFILRLDEAILQQRGKNEQALSLLQLGRSELLEAQRKMKSFDTLAERHMQSEMKLAAKSEQRLQDEHTGRISSIKASAEQNEN
jgi:flagellar FliJ protein